MNKQAIKVDLPTVARAGLGGVVAGGSAMALLNLVRKSREMLAERKARRGEQETDEDTIVITLPPKQGEITSKKATKVSSKSTTRVTLAEGNGRQSRRALDGTFGCKTAAGWPTLTATTIAGVGGIGLGAHLVNKIYERRRMKELEAELEAAQQEYVGRLRGGKVAECIEDIFAVPMAKDAQSKLFGFLDYPLAAAALLTMLGTGGTAYITKKVMDDKFREAERRGLDIPKAKRIVFRTSPRPVDSEEEEEKISGYEPGTLEDVECIDAALGIMTDKVGERTLVLEQPAVKSAMASEGTSTLKLLKMAQDTDELIEYLRQTPTLRKMIQRSFMEQHPTYKHMRFMASVPGIRGIMDKKLYAAIGNMGANQGMMGANQGMMGGAKTAANLGIPSMLLSSVVGSDIASEPMDPDAIAQAVVRAQDAKRKRGKLKKTPTQRVSEIEVGAADADAHAYLQQNKDHVLALLKDMAAAGKL